MVAIGASTGGPSALATVLAGLAGVHAPVLVVQHLHPDFTSGLLDLLARSSALPVRMAAARRGSCCRGRSTWHPATCT